MNIGKVIFEAEFEDPEATPAPVEPAIPATPVTVPAEEPVSV